MTFISHRSLRRTCLAAALGVAALAPHGPVLASEFSVTPIRVELKPGALNETITVTNDSAARLRVTVKLVEWTQDAAGKDVYLESSDLVYFPRQLELEPGAKRLVRVGAKAPATGTERTYRLFIEEVPEPSSATASVAVTFYFRFGVPVFLPPAVPRPQPEVLEPTLDKGKLSVVVKNTGNQSFRLNKLIITDGAGYAQEVAGWYSLAGTSRAYTADIPREACRKAAALSVRIEGEGVSLDRRLQVDPANCS